MELKFLPPADSESGADKDPHYLGHRKRLKQRFLADPEKLPDYELIEIMLYYVYPRRDTKPMAKTLLSDFGSLTRMFLDSGPALEKRSCNALAVLVRLVHEVAKRLSLEEVRQQTLLNNSVKVMEYCRLVMSHLTVEQFRVFFLDKKYYLISDEVQHTGTLDETSLYPREVMKRALSLNAAALILVHNHPSGDSTPSKADIMLTDHMKSSLLPFNIHVLDHLIIGKYGSFSFRKEGFLN
jgi:DNA repair protein RadC